MKRIFLLCLTLGMMTSLYAEWKTSDTDATNISANGQYGQVQLLSTRNANGVTALTWLRISDLDYDDPGFGYYLYLQIYDAEGNAIFPEGGKLVSAQPTLSWVSGYSLTTTKDGNFLIAYADNRAQEEYTTRVFTYCYNEKGESVWDAAGVSHTAVSVHNSGNEMSPKIVVSGENVYLYFAHSESWQEEATEENWEPTPWETEMPEYVTVNSENYQIYRLNPADGSHLWEQPVVVETSSLFAYPAPDGDIYTLFTDTNCLLYAQRLTSVATYSWKDDAEVSDAPLSYYGFVNDISAVQTEDGGLAVAMTVPTSFDAYNCINHITPDGDTYLSPLSMVEDPNVGNCSLAALGTRGDKTMALWPYALSYTENYMKCNLFNHSAPGNYAWKGENMYGRSLGVNDMWGMKALKVVPQNDGWVLFYADLQSWSGANMIIVKVDDNGSEMWRKQIGEDDFACSSNTIESDGDHLFFFYSIEQEYDENWEPIPGDGGMYMMCIDITNEGNPTGIKRTPTTASHVTYDIMGRKTTSNHHGIIIENGRKILR